MNSIKTFLARLLKGYSEADRISALEKVYDSFPEAGAIICLTSGEFNALKTEKGIKKSSTSIFERNIDGNLIEITKIPINRFPF